MSHSCCSVGVDDVLVLQWEESSHTSINLVYQFSVLFLCDDFVGRCLYQAVIIMVPVREFIEYFVSYSCCSVSVGVLVLQREEGSCSVFNFCVLILKEGVCTKLSS